MTSDTERALLRGIWQKPTDTLRRLVYADWLQENGYEWEADAVRYWCQIDPTDRAFLRSRYTADPNCDTVSERFVYGDLNRPWLREWGTYRDPYPLIKQGVRLRLRERLIRLKPYLTTAKKK